MKDELPYILEWMAYHEVIGFERIIIYDNGSTDGTAAILTALENFGRIKYVPWPDERGQVPQYSAYVDALSQISTEWVAFLDIDEFLLLKSHLCITDFLRSFSESVGAIAVNWKMFGSSGQRTRKQGLVIERFTKCSDLSHGTYQNSEYGFSWQIKSIARVRAVKQIGLHFHDLEESSSYVNAIGQQYLERSVNHDGAQVNHYAVKSWEEFIEKTKKNRVNFTPEQNAKREYWEGNVEQTGWSQYFECYDLNAFEDRSMLKYVDVVNKRVSELKRLLKLGADFEAALTP